MYLLLRNVTYTNRLKSCFPGKPTGTQTPSQPILLSRHCLPLCPLYLQTAWTGQQLKWIPGSSKPTKKKARHPPEADGLVLQVLFIFSAHQERLADLLEGWPILLGFRKCLFGSVAFTQGKMSHLLSQRSRGSSSRRVLSVQLTRRPSSVLKTQAWDT